jgi:hypothetical protein
MTCWTNWKFDSVSANGAHLRGGGKDSLLRSIVIGTVVGLAILSLVGGCLILAHYLFWPDLLLKRTRYFQMSAIEKAVRLYNERHQSPADSLEVLVRAGLLPERSRLYSCCARFRSLRPPIAGYSEGDYEVIRGTNGVFVAVKPSTLQIILKHPEFRRIKTNKFAAWVDDAERI